MTNKRNIAKFSSLKKSINKAEIIMSLTFHILPQLDNVTLALELLHDCGFQIANVEPQGEEPTHIKHKLQAC